MSGENCLIFRISQFSWVDLHSNILQLWENGEEFWNKVFRMLSPGALVRWCMKPASRNYTLRKKKCNFPNFLRVGFSLFYRYSNFWVLHKNREQFWNRVFAHCYQEHCQNVIHYKGHLSTFFPKRNATFHAAFLLKLSVTAVLVGRYWLLPWSLLIPTSSIRTPCCRDSPSLLLRKENASVQSHSSIALFFQLHQLLAIIGFCTPTHNGFQSLMAHCCVWTVHALATVNICLQM